MGQQRASSDEYANASAAYHYPEWIDLANKAAGIFMFFLGLGSLLLTCWPLATIGSWQQFAEWGRNSWGNLLWSLPWLIGAGVLIHLCPSITVGPAGLETTVLFGIPVHIPWNEVLAVKEASMFPGRHSRRIILVKRLTPWHSMISLIGCLDLRPGLFITDDIRGYHELVKSIEAHLSHS